MKRKPKPKIVPFRALAVGAEFLKCYDFDEVPPVVLAFVKLNKRAAIRRKPVVFEGRAIFFRADQPVLKEKG